MSIKEIVFISGKGGTGKTTMTSSFIPRFKNLVIADCDVDAPDLDILLKPQILTTEDFIATTKAVINSDKCLNCGKCISFCNFNAIEAGDNTPIIKESHCEGCKTCTLVCKPNAIEIKPYKTGVIYKSTTDYGSMIHARLTPGEEVSGRLVSEVRKRAKLTAEKNNNEIIIIDGPPGIACNVISAITGSSLAIIVTEPTVSGFHDLVRVSDTANKLRVKCAVIINKFGLSDRYTKEIEEYCEKNSISILGKVSLNKEILRSVNKLEIPNINNHDMVNKVKEIIYN